MKPHDKPFEIAADKGGVHVDGSGGGEIATTREGAAETSELLPVRWTRG